MKDAVILPVFLVLFAFGGSFSREFEARVRSIPPVLGECEVSGIPGIGVLINGSCKALASVETVSHATPCTVGSWLITNETGQVVCAEYKCDPGQYYLDDYCYFKSELNCTKEQLVNMNATGDIESPTCGCQPGNGLYNGSCESLGNYSSVSDDKPCPVGSWLVLDSNNNTICKEYNCTSNSIIDYCQSVLPMCNNLTDEKVLRDSDNTSCYCLEDYYFYPEKRICYELYKRGPCSSDEIIGLNVTNGHAKCISNPCKDEKVFADDGGCIEIGGPCQKNGSSILASSSPPVYEYEYDNGTYVDYSEENGTFVDYTTEDGSYVDYSTTATDGKWTVVAHSNNSVEVVCKDKEYIYEFVSFLLDVEINNCSEGFVRIFNGRCQPITVLCPDGFELNFLGECIEPLGLGK